MKARRYATSRQKACLRCSAAKAKCDRNAPRCHRCALRSLSCSYFQALPTENPSNDMSDSATGELDIPLSTADVLSTSQRLFPIPEQDLPTTTNIESSILASRQQSGSNDINNTSPTLLVENAISRNLSVTRQVSPSPEAPDFLSLDSHSELFCPINAEEIRNRWLNSFIPISGGKTKEYPASIVAFIYRILKAYAAVTIHGRGIPPFVHATQMMGISMMSTLSTCLTLARVCDKPFPGSESVAVDILQREMNNLYDQHGTYDDLALLAAFQSYLVYSLILYFGLNQSSSIFLRQAMMNLQDLACSSSRKGLLCTAERQHSRPSWEAWIVAEAKRRTLFTMYLFDSVISAQDRLPTMLGTELQGLPSPANQSLWKARTRREWETAYNTHLAEWEEGLQINELWPTPANMDESDITERRKRVDQWLETVDEFGTMLYAVTSCTHGG